MLKYYITISWLAIFGFLANPALALAAPAQQSPIIGLPLDSSALAEIDSQYGILEAERQQLVRLAAQTALEQARAARWAREFDVPTQNSTILHATYTRAREAIAARAEFVTAQARALEEFVARAIAAESHLTPEVRKTPADAPMFLERRNAPLSSNPFAALKGVLPWPAKGSISSVFGVRKNAIYGTDTENPGIDLAVTEAAPVAAVAAGTVANIAWLRGYGIVCILDHPTQHHTVYARLQNVTVKKGQAVSAGTVLGTAEFDSLNNSFALHFEVWAGKEKQDPLLWLAPVKN